MSSDASKSCIFRCWFQCFRLYILILLFIPSFANDRRKELYEMSDGWPITVPNEEFYNKYILEEPRKEDFIVLFVSRSPLHQCTQCRNAIAEFHLTVESYMSMTKDEPSKWNYKHHFFLIVDYEIAKNIFELHEIDKIPQIGYFASTDRASSLSTEKTPHFFSHRTEKAENMAQFLRSKIGVNIPILRSSSWFDFLLKCTAGVYCVGILGSLVLKYHGSMLEKHLWIVLSYSVLAISLSGTVYSILRGTPPFYVGPYGFYLFHPHSGQQFGLEGWIMAFGFFFCSFMVFLLCRVIPYLKSQERRNTGILICGMGYLLTYKFISIIYAYKHPWYRGF